MKIHVNMYGNRKEAEIGQRENWLALQKMGLGIKCDLLDLTIYISHEAKLLHLSPRDWQRMYGIKIEGFKICGTFYSTTDNMKILDKLELCKRR